LLAVDRDCLLVKPGPRREGAGTNQKPDIAAPGLEITSAKADAANLRGRCCDCCPDACCCLYEDLTGTSMAAPHVAGAIALLLEENPRLTRAELVRHLQATARERPAGGWDATWGGGKLNIQAAIDAVRAAGPGGGGGGGGGIPRILPPAGFDESFRREPKTSSFSGSPAPLTSWLRTLRERLKDYPEGEHVAAAISRHFSEARRLINSNRRIATMWHRAAGPALLRRLLRGPGTADGPLSIEIASASRYLDRCLEMLARQGSPRLQQSLARYQSFLTMLLMEHASTPSELRVMSRL
jgi:hypothetical protein